MSPEPACCNLTTTGRRTGRPHTIEIWFARTGTTLYLLSGARERSDWVRNVMATPEVGVGLDGEQHSATARVVAGGTEEDATARRLLLEKYERPGRHDLEGWGRNALVVAIDLTGADP